MHQCIMLGADGSTPSAATDQPHSARTAPARSAIGWLYTVDLIDSWGKGSGSVWTEGLCERCGVHGVRLAFERVSACAWDRAGQRSDRVPQKRWAGAAVHHERCCAHGRRLPNSVPFNDPSRTALAPRSILMPGYSSVVVSRSSAVSRSRSRALNAAQIGYDHPSFRLVP